MTKIPPDDILEGLYKLRIRVSEKLKTVLELYDLEIHQNKLGPDYHRLKTMVKRSIEQNMAREMGSPRHVSNKRRRTREGPEPACVRSPFLDTGWHTQGRKDELTSCRGTI